MRAVNLIPDDLGGGSAGRTGPAVYVLLGGLTLALVLVAGWAQMGQRLEERRADVERVTAEAGAAEARAAGLQGYQRVNELRRTRVETVTALSRARFNWAYAIREISNNLPRNVWLIQLDGTIGGASATQGAGAAAGPATPQIALSGCTSSQSDVAKYLAALRAVDGVTRVALSQTATEDKPAADAASASSGSKGGDCPRAAKARFQATIHFEKSSAPAVSGAATAPAAPAGDKPAADKSSATSTTAAPSPPATGGQPAGGSK